MELATVHETLMIALDIPRFIEYSLVILIIGYILGKNRRIRNEKSN